MDHTQLKQLARQIICDLQEASIKVPRRNRKGWIKEWVETAMAHLSPREREDLIDHLIVMIGKRRKRDASILGYISTHSWGTHGWRGCPRMNGGRVYAIRDPWDWHFDLSRRDSVGPVNNRCRFCWTEDDEERLKQAQTAQPGEYHLGLVV